MPVKHTKTEIVDLIWCEFLILCHRLLTCDRVTIPVTTLTFKSKEFVESHNALWQSLLNWGVELLYCIYIPLKKWNITNPTMEAWKMCGPLSKWMLCRFYVSCRGYQFFMRNNKRPTNLQLIAIDLLLHLEPNESMIPGVWDEFPGNGGFHTPENSHFEPPPKVGGLDNPMFLLFLLCILSFQETQPFVFRE